MSKLALIHPNDLLAVELRESLDRRRDLWQELVLLSSSEDEIGSLTEVRGAAAMVQGVDAHSLDGIDVAFFSGPIAANRELIAALPSQSAAVVLSPDAEPDDGLPIVAGVNLAAANRDTAMISPHPATVLLAHLLHPLRGFEPRLAVATVLQPVSMVGKAGLDEMLDQTRSILSFDNDPPREVFPHQMVFNVVPAQTRGNALEQQLRTVLDLPVAISIGQLQAGIFHSFSVSLYLELAADPGREALREALASHPANELSQEPATLGPIDAAAADRVIVAEVEAADPASSGDGGRYRLWAVMDNLTCGGALNAIQILEAISRQVTH